MLHGDFTIVLIQPISDKMESRNPFLGGMIRCVNSFEEIFHLAFIFHPMSEIEPFLMSGEALSQTNEGISAGECRSDLEPSGLQCISPCLSFGGLVRQVGGVLVEFLYRCLNLNFRTVVWQGNATQPSTWLCPDKPIEIPTQ